MLLRQRSRCASVPADLIRASRSPARGGARAGDRETFPRLRKGGGRPRAQKNPPSFVLEAFTAAERAEVPTISEQAADATELLIAQGLEPAQNTVHAW